MERLDKVLAGTGRWSRADVKKMCRAGRVTVSGEVIKTPETKVGAEAVIAVDGEKIISEKIVWIMLHKPAGVVSATEDEKEKTVLSLLPEQYSRMGVFPVGRLDKDTEGLLLLTNDGETAHYLLSPKRHVEKVYYVETEGEQDAEDVETLRKGITLLDGTVCLPAELRLLGGYRSEITLREGKYHQVKRMMAARGKPVRYLKRIAFGPLALDEGLQKGEWRFLTEEERAKLNSAW